MIERGRRRILHFNVTQYPSADWVVQQLREAFPEAAPYRYAILDRDSIFDAEVIAFLKATGLKPKRTSRQAPRQHGIAERWIGGCRREILHHVIALNEQHLRRLIREYVRYHHEDRIHDSLDKDTSQSARRRAKTGRRRHGDIAAAPGRPPSSIRLAASSVNSRPADDQDRESTILVGLWRTVQPVPEQGSAEAVSPPRHRNRAAECPSGAWLPCL